MLQSLSSQYTRSACVCTHPHLGTDHTTVFLPAWRRHLNIYIHSNARTLAHTLTRTHAHKHARTYDMCTHIKAVLHHHPLRILHYLIHIFIALWIQCLPTQPLIIHLKINMCTLYPEVINWANDIQPKKIISGL